MPDGDRRERRATRVAGSAFLAALVAGIGLIVTYLRGGQTQVEGLLLFVAFAGVSVGLGVWVKVLIDEDDVTEERPVLASTPADVRAFETALDEAAGAPPPASAARRHFLTRLLVATGASIGAALLLPLRSLGPSPRNELFRTPWRRNVRLVGYDGRPYRAEDLEVGSIVTVFPEHAVGSADAQAVLIAVEPGSLELDADAPETPDGLVCYSKICTHAGCPVGLYRAEAHELLCPCHQSKFDVLRGARPLSGPTTRPLPQLPLGVDDEGYLIARGDFPVPVGPAFWNIDRGA